jgi:hypothetical protein
MSENAPPPPPPVPPVDQRATVNTVPIADGEYENHCTVCGNIGDEGIPQHLIRKHVGGS